MSQLIGHRRSIVVRPWPRLPIVLDMYMAGRSYIAGGVSGHPGGCHSANRHRQVPGWEPPMDVTMFWGRNANERDGYRAPPVIGWNSRIRRTPGHLTVPVRRVCCRLEELMWYDEGRSLRTRILVRFFPLAAEKGYV